MLFDMSPEKVSEAKENAGKVYDSLICTFPPIQNELNAALSFLPQDLVSIIARYFNFYIKDYSFFLDKIKTYKNNPIVVRFLLEKIYGEEISHQLLDIFRQERKKSLLNFLNSPSLPNTFNFPESKQSLQNSLRKELNGDEHDWYLIACNIPNLSNAYFKELERHPLKRFINNKFWYFDLSGINIPKGSTFQDGQLLHVACRRIDYKSTTFKETTFTNMYMPMIDLTDSSLEGVEFIRSDLSFSILKHIDEGTGNGSRCTFRDCNLMNATFDCWGIPFEGEGWREGATILDSNLQGMRMIFDDSCDCNIIPPPHLYRTIFNVLEKIPNLNRSRFPIYCNPNSMVLIFKHLLTESMKNLFYQDDVEQFIKNNDSWLTDSQVLVCDVIWRLFQVIRRSYSIPENGTLNLKQIDPTLYHIGQFIVGYNFGDHDGEIIYQQLLTGQYTPVLPTPEPIIDDDQKSTNRFLRPGKFLQLFSSDIFSHLSSSSSLSTFSRSSSSSSSSSIPISTPRHEMIEPSSSTSLTSQPT